MNVARIKAVAKRLGAIAEEIVFVGGAVTGFLVSDPAAAEVRPTKDVDVITNVQSRMEYAAIEETLRKLGLRHNIDAATCSFQFEDPQLGEILLDFMPTDEKVLLLRSQWYKAAFVNAIMFDIGDGLCVRIISAPYFLATKLEAFADRGRLDYYGSTDMSDIIQVLDGRPELLQEICQAEPDLKLYLNDRFKHLLVDGSFRESIEGHLRPDSISWQRASLVLERARELARITEPST